MEIKIRNYNQAQYLQEGGAVAAPAEDSNAAPAEGTPATPESGEDPMQQIAMACQQALETQDCNLAMQVCQAIMQMIGGGAPAAPEGQQPVFKKGGKLSKWISK